MNKVIIPFEIYTDGAAKGQDAAHKSGGWAYCILRDGDIIRKDSGSVFDTTNQRMELQAAIEALKVIRENYWDARYEYHIYSDSAYLTNCYLKEWWKNWVSNGWVNSSKKPVANVDLWEELIPYFESKSVFLHKVQGHANNKYNNLVDTMAQKAARQVRGLE